MYGLSGAEESGKGGCGMNELDLYKFIESECEAPVWSGNELWLNVSQPDIPDFIKLVGWLLDDKGMDVVLTHHGISLDIVPMCECCDIDPERILSKP